MKLLLYCTKAKPEFYSMNRVYDDKRLFDIVKGSKKEIEEKTNSLLCMNNLKMLNGKIVAECDFEVEKLQIIYGKGWETKTIKGTENIEKLTPQERERIYCVVNAMIDYN